MKQNILLIKEKYKNKVKKHQPFYLVIESN